uniref:GNAT family N-acetyltransferase n=1 Tax=Fodinicola feengrottensis TaxID=435914 RepID=UPI0013D175B3|nr:GNAT family N-acetyltransferase [Fodinicola feengrottensis]
MAGWYGQRGLPAMLQVPLPVRAELVRPLEDAGFVRGHGARVLTASVSSVAEAVRTDLPAIEWAAAPDDGWLSLYHYRGGDLPDSAVPVLVAGADVRFGTLRIDGAVAGICRTSSASGWLGDLTAVEVSPVFRRQGLATHLLRSAAARTDAEGVYLQVEHGKTRRPWRSTHAAASPSTTSISTGVWTPSKRVSGNCGGSRVEIQVLSGGAAGSSAYRCCMCSVRRCRQAGPGLGYRPPQFPDTLLRA